jgi:hypothetical protein
MNPFSEDELYDLTFRVCVASVKHAFPHIPVANIIDPPRGQFDATLARQIVMHVMIARFGLAKKRAGKLVGRHRISINRAIEVIDCRLEEPEFEAEYATIAERAASMFEDKLREAA